MGALQLWERPESITQLCAFLGCCNYYHLFLPLHAKYSGPLTELLKVGKVLDICEAMDFLSILSCKTHLYFHSLK